MDPTGNPKTKIETQDQADRGPRTQGSTSINRRDWLRLAVGGGAGLAVGELLDLSTVRAATQNLKLANVSEFTTSCNFCSCGCGMIAAVRDGKLISMEGDYDHIVNRGSLCVKGISMFATHASPNRLMTPKYRAPGSDHWEEISWDDAVNRIAQKIRKTRDATWIATEDGRRQGGSGQSNRRDRHFWAARRTRTRSATSSRRRPGCSAWLTSSTRRDFDTAPRSPVWGPRSGGGR